MTALLSFPVVQFLFNRLSMTKEVKFSLPQEYIITSVQTILLFLAGVGSGKTHIIGFQSGYLLQKFPKVFGFIGANTYLQLSQSTLFRTLSVWQEIFGWKENVHFVMDKKPPRGYNTEGHNFKSYSGIISFKTGQVVFVGSLENAKAHDGKEFGWAFLDETKDSREEDVKEIILARLRAGGIYIDKNYQLTDKEEDPETKRLHDVFNPLYITTSPAKVLWINEWFEIDKFQDEILNLIYNKDEFFIKEFADKCIVISSTYHNEINLPKGYIAKLNGNLTAEKAKMLVFGNPFVRSGGEFYSGFERLRHVIPLRTTVAKYKPGDAPNANFKDWLPIHMSFDQNVVPYITACLYQIEYTVDGKKIVTQFDEICLENPRNKTSKLCLEFIRRWGAKCKSGLYFYGDPGGKRGDTRDGVSDYATVERILKRFLNNKSNRVAFKYPPVLKRKDFSNDIFEGKYSDMVFYCNATCKKSVADFEFIKEDTNGKKLKEKVKDPATGVTYEKFGHTSDAWDYFITGAFEKLFEANYTDP